MKSIKYVALIMLSIASFGLFMSAAKADEKKDTVSVEAYVYCYGNEPFIYPGITTVKGKEYFVVADDSLKLELLNNQAKKLLITGYIIKKGTTYPVMKDGSFEVIEFKEIQ